MNQMKQMNKAEKFLNKTNAETDAIPREVVVDLLEKYLQSRVKEVESEINDDSFGDFSFENTLGGNLVIKKLRDSYIETSEYLPYDRVKTIRKISLNPSSLEEGEIVTLMAYHKEKNKWKAKTNKGRVFFLRETDFVLNKDTEESKYKAKDKVTVVKNTSSHGFCIGEVVTLFDYDDSDREKENGAWAAEGCGGESWFIQEAEFVSIETKTKTPCKVCGGTELNPKDNPNCKC